ncbi:MAG: hypothetical protein IPM64_02970 [Phycisphaerales bacterium]|nr:hypothetical protein [Phycisphaerales bacterium]
MPELPEVESIVRANRDRLVGRTFTDFETSWPRNTLPAPDAVRDALRGRLIADVWRRAKYIIFTLAAPSADAGRGADAGQKAVAGSPMRGAPLATGHTKRPAALSPHAARPAAPSPHAARPAAPSPLSARRSNGRQSPGYLLIHLRMSGRLEWGDPVLPGQKRPAATRSGISGSDVPRPDAPHTRAVFTLDDGARLLFCDARKFGRILWTRDLTSVTADLGVEPLEPEFTAGLLADLLTRRSGRIKPLLLDQSVVAGIGNIYADEALHRAGLHPLTPGNRVSPAAVKRLCHAIRSVLRAAIRHNGTSFDWVYPTGTMQDHLRVYGRTGEACRTCGTAIEALRVGQRGTHLCPRCQPAPRGASSGGRALRSASPRV